MQNSKILDNYYQKLLAGNEQTACLNDEDLTTLIRKIIKEELCILNLGDSVPKEPEFLSIKEAACFLNLAVATLYEKTSRKLIPFHKRDKKLYFKKQELTEWLLGKRSEAVVLKLPVLKKNKKAA